MQGSLYFIDFNIIPKGQVLKLLNLVIIPDFLRYSFFFQNGSNCGSLY